MTAGGDGMHQEVRDRIVAEFGGGHAVEGIALRYGLTVAQVYAVVQGEVAPGDQRPVGESPGRPDEDAIVAEYAEGHDVGAIARRHGIDVSQVYAVVQRTVDDRPRPGPRDIPPLYPAYFLELLGRAQVAASPVNVARLVERTAFMIGCQGAAYCAQLRDPAAFEVFVRNFARGGIPDRRPYLVDDMVDWLWAWNPGCHDDLRRRFPGWRDGLLGTESFLIPGQDIAPFTGDEGAGFQHEGTWRTVYAQNAR